MRSSSVLGAQLSYAVYGSKGSFERELNSVPATVFQYYYRSKLKELVPWSSGLESNAFRRHIRKEWDLLSTSRKRLYYAFFFHFTKTDYRSLNKYELARILEIPTPAISEYMLFRNNFKNKYDDMGLQERKMRPGKRNTVVGRLVMISHRTAIQDDERLNLTKRFQKMCRECRYVWNKKISAEQKEDIRSKWEDQKNEFELSLTRELEALSSNLSRLLKLNVDAQIKSLKIDRYKPSTMTSDMIIPYVFHKKK